VKFETMALEASRPVAELRLSRPEAGNPADGGLLGDLERACEILRDDDAVRVVLLTSQGEAFSRGGEGAPDPARAPFRCLELLPQPVIAVIEGEASGPGLELALACDLRVASEGATFAMPQVGEGRVPSGGGTQRLPRLVGRSRAAWMLLLGERLGAAEAAACGLVNAVTPAGGARAEAERMAASICAQGPLAVRYAKEAILRGLDMPLEQALRYETDLTVILQTTEDRAEGVRAFLEKRKARFEGR
jgi:enoyl-CoA hydratase